MVLPMVSMMVPMGMVLLAILSVEGEGVGEGTSWGSPRTPDWGSSRTNGTGPYLCNLYLASFGLSGPRCPSAPWLAKTAMRTRKSRNVILVYSSWTRWYKNGQGINKNCFMGFWFYWTGTYYCMCYVAFKEHLKVLSCIGTPFGTSSSNKDLY